MKPNYVKLILLAALFVLLTGEERAQFHGYSAPEAKGPKMAKVLTMDNNGGEASLVHGEMLQVELEITGGTGYDWHVEGLDETHLKFIGKKTRAVTPGNIAGGPVLGVWSFKAAAPGDTVLKMLYYRIWEGSKHPAGRFEVKLHIMSR